jgi:DNA-directed RNA polymerase I subunit RPA12
MAAIGSLVFCTDCGNLLDETEGKNVLLHCDVCGAFCRGQWS